MWARGKLVQKLQKCRQIDGSQKSSSSSSEDPSGDTDENKIEILEWEKEWWQKVDAKLSS